MTSLLIGDSSLQNIDNLYKIANLKDLHSLNEKYGTNFTNFEPWMSLWFSDVVEGNLNFFESLMCKDIFVKDVKKLNRLNDLLKIDGVSFKLINSMSLNSEQICTNMEELKNFEDLMYQSLDLIRCSYPLMFNYFHRIIKKVILRSEISDSLIKTRLNGTGLSSHYFLGGVFLSYPKEKSLKKVDLAINLVHELGHHVLMIYQRFDSIIKGNLFTDSYSPVRMELRPAILSFHALVASYFMIEFIEKLIFDDSLSKYEIDYLRKYLFKLVNESQLSIQSFSDIKLTVLGFDILNEIKEKVTFQKQRAYEFV